MGPRRSAGENALATVARNGTVLGERTLSDYPVAKRLLAHYVLRPAVGFRVSGAAPLLARHLFRSTGGSRDRTAPGTLKLLTRVTIASSGSGRKIRATRLARGTAARTNGILLGGFLSGVSKVSWRTGARVVESVAGKLSL